MTVFDAINRERQRQIDRGFDADHDDGHCDGSLSHAALLALCNVTGHYLGCCAQPSADGPWPDQFVLHMKQKYDGNDTQKLVIAAALIVAEIERLDRARERRIAAELEEANHEGPGQV